MSHLKSLTSSRSRRPPEVFVELHYVKSSPATHKALKPYYNNDQIVILCRRTGTSRAAQLPSSRGDTGIASHNSFFLLSDLTHPLPTSKRAGLTAKPPPPTHYYFTTSLFCSRLPVLCVRVHTTASCSLVVLAGE